MANRESSRNRKDTAFDVPSVLVVEDNRPNRILIEALLDALGCDVGLASSGAEALELAGRERFDLVLMDIHMPKMDGIETLRRLRSQAGPNAMTPVAAITANAYDDDHKTFYDAGVAAILVKPISSIRLAEVINACIGADGSPPAA